MWIAASFVWLVGAGAFLQEDIRRDVSALMTDIAAETTQKLKSLAPLPPGVVLDSEIEARAAAQSDLIIAASAILLPPILAFALGWVGLWVVRGFRS